ncbi:Ubiquitin--protein ligase [Handroanthus impetiginosus]|uniref:RING-type E3 ubiquitin transferase n=1 Tax=Handroanthus impetiginosus TaxID=429701 RepID=A0A2G9GEH6_9LAMI|nr:Ubiquitin--protein ligase [Handroanthus impetiginosus]
MEEHYSFNHDQLQSDITVSVGRVSASCDRNALLPFYINLEFSCNAILSKWIFDEHIPTQARCLEVVNAPSMVAIVPLSLNEFLHNEKACEIIAGEIQDFPLWDIECQKVIDFVLRKAWEYVISMPPNHNVLHLHFRMAVLNKLFVVENLDLVDWMIQHSMEVDEVPMIPTKDSLIESLERKKVSMMDSGTCTICLEEFPAGYEAVCMPCSHIFHGDCIKKWLRTSHYCPICRFEMPTS